MPVRACLSSIFEITHKCIFPPLDPVFTVSVQKRPLMASTSPNKPKLKLSADIHAGAEANGKRSAGFLQTSGASSAARGHYCGVISVHAWQKEKFALYLNESEGFMIQVHLHVWEVFQDEDGQVWEAAARGKTSKRVFRVPLEIMSTLKSFKSKPKELIGASRIHQPSRTSETFKWWSKLSDK